MGKKKPFIDKRNSSTYHILYRSQRDVAGGDDDQVETSNNAGVVLWPSPNNNKETDTKVLLGEKGNKSEQINIQDSKLLEWKSTLSKVGCVDEFDYEKHMKPISGTGQYLSNNTIPVNKKSINAMFDARSLDVKEEIIQEVDRQLDSIALTADCMDDDIAQALFGEFDENEYEEINDDFVFDAAKEPEKNDEEDDTFDFAAHIKGLMEKAKQESQDGGNLSTIHEQGKQDQDFFSNAKSIEKRGQRNDDDSGYFVENDYHIEGTPGIVPKLTPEEEEALCDKFNETLAEYDSDDFGEGCDDDDIYGDLPLEGDTQVEAALDDFLQGKKDDIFMQGHDVDKKKNGGSGFSALVGTKMVPVKDIVEQTPTKSQDRSTIRPISDILGEADDTLEISQTAPPAEEIFIDGKSYFSEKIRNPWDCESILSTYSNLDNNPVTICGGGRRRRKATSKKGKNSSGTSSIPQEDNQQIVLSEKTGLPLGVLPSKVDYEEEDFDTYVSVNKGEARRKDETPEEKKLRKLNVQKERQSARIQKKMMKEAFNDEFAKRQLEVAVDDVGGKSVFRF